MPTEEYKLVLNLVGQESVKALNTLLEQQKVAVKELATAYEQGKITQQEFITKGTQLGTQIQDTSQKLLQLRGTPGISGTGFLAASYAAQDFISVLSGGGGLGRALGSISNNIPQILAGLGVTAGLAGAFGAVTAAVAGLTPLLTGLFTGMSAEDLQNAKDKIKEVAEEWKKVQDEYRKALGKPTEYQEESAKQTAQYLTGPIAGRVAAAAAGLTGRAEAEAAMAPEAKAEYEKIAPLAGMTDEELRELEIRAEEKGDIQGARAVADLRTRRDAARQRRADLLGEAKQARAQGLVAAAGKPGEAGGAARSKLMELAGQRPEDFPVEFGEAMMRMSPEEIEQNQRAHEEFTKRAEIDQRNRAKRREMEDRALRGMADDVERSNKGGEAFRKAKGEARARQEQGQIEARQKERDMRHQALGDANVAAAEIAMLDSASPRTRREIARQARGQFMGRGMNREQATRQALEFAEQGGDLDQLMRQQLRNMGPAGRGQRGKMALAEALQQVIQNQAMIAQNEAMAGAQLKAQGKQVGGMLNKVRTQATHGLGGG